MTRMNHAEMVRRSLWRFVSCNKQSLWHVWVMLRWWDIAYGTYESCWDGEMMATLWHELNNSGVLGLISCRATTAKLMNYETYYDEQAWGMNADLIWRESGLDMVLDLNCGTSFARSQVGRHETLPRDSQCDDSECGLLKHDTYDPDA